MFYRRYESHKSSALNVPDFMIAIFLLEVDTIENNSLIIQRGLSMETSNIQKNLSQSFHNLFCKFIINNIINRNLFLLYLNIPLLYIYNIFSLIFIKYSLFISKIILNNIELNNIKFLLNI